jgi:hypothetical protein
MHNHNQTDIRDEAAYEAGRNRAIRANARKGKRDRWLAEDATREAVITFLDIRGRDGGFLAKMFEGLEEWGTLTAGQEAAVRKIMAQDAEKKAKWAERDAKSGHVGTVGERREFTATVTFVTSFDSQYGIVTITGLRDADDNVLIHKGTGWAEKGDTVTFTATVKDHGERNGVKQTIVTRPKVVTVKQGAAPVAAAPTEIAPAHVEQAPTFAPAKRLTLVELAEQIAKNNASHGN